MSNHQKLMTQSKDISVMLTANNDSLFHAIISITLTYLLDSIVNKSI